MALEGLYLLWLMRTGDSQQSNILDQVEQYLNS